MALKKIGSGYGGTGLTELPAAVKQLQSVKQVIVDGAAANTNIAIAGLELSSHVLFVQNLTDLATVVAVAAPFAAGQLRIAADTTGKKLLITYLQ